MYKLQDDNERPDFQLLGINTQLKDFKLCVLLNELLSIDFSLMEDHKVILKKNEKETKFRVFYAKNSIAKINYLLFHNKSGSQYLVPEVKKMDFLLKIDGLYNNTDYTSLINSTEGIQAVVSLPVHKIKSYNNLEYFIPKQETNTLWQQNITKRKS
jgi:hypothetical protein